MKKRFWRVLAMGDARSRKEFMYSVTAGGQTRHHNDLEKLMDHLVLVDGRYEWNRHTVNQFGSYAPACCGMDLG